MTVAAPLQLPLTTLNANEPYVTKYPRTKQRPTAFSGYCVPRQWSTNVRPREICNLFASSQPQPHSHTPLDSPFNFSPPPHVCQQLIFWTAFNRPSFPGH